MIKTKNQQIKLVQRHNSKKRFQGWHSALPNMCEALKQILSTTKRNYECSSNMTSVLNAERNYKTKSVRVVIKNEKGGGKH